MKRCSQCDFIYEDDQHLCDMDGHELDYEPTFQSLQVSAAAKLSTRPVQSPGRRLVVLAAAAMLIGTILSVGYSGFTSEYIPENTKGRSTNVIRAPQSTLDQTPVRPAVRPTPTVSPTPEPGNSPRSDKTK
ncbi:MAG: hypothetical protein ACREBC_36545, partial [Pyrinomonadaceae bacterium]